MYFIYYVYSVDPIKTNCWMLSASYLSLPKVGGKTNALSEEMVVVMIVSMVIIQ
jgi:hypothetical protein